MKKILIGLVLLSLGMSSWAADVERDRSYMYLGIRAGSLMVDTLDDDHDATLGFMAGVRLNEAVALELSYDDQFNGLLGTGWSSDALQASVLLYLLPSNAQVQPYLVGGVGVYMSSYNYWATDGWDDYIVSEVDYTDGGFHAGGGVDIYVNQSVALTIDGRYIFVEEDRPDTIDSDGFLATFGVKFRF